MNKKVMALAVAGAFATPAVALAQASNVQIYGTVYMEYSLAHQGAANGTPSPGDLVNIDLLQSPGSEIGIKGEEALGGGYSAWFQCASTADIRGAGTGGGIQGFCGRNSAIGLKGAFGNLFTGNWDMPMKRTAGAVRIVSDTGIWGAGPLLFGNSTTTVGRSAATTWSRRQNASIFYDSPVYAGFQVFAGVSTPIQDIASLNVASNGKARMWGVAANYTNGPLLLTAGYENHSNFQPSAATVTGNTGGTPAMNTTYTGQDQAWQVGAAYQFGPIKAGILYTSQKHDTGIQTIGVATVTDMKITAWNIAGEWNVLGPHSIRGGFTKANNTSGNFGSVGSGGITAAGTFYSVGGAASLRSANGGAGGTGATIWQVQYVFNASKRTEFTAGYARIGNDPFARYNLGGLTAPKAGENQDAFAVSWKHLF